MFTIYHNTRCSKSRQTLALLEENTKDFTIVEYLKSPLNKSELTQLLTQLNCSALEMMRTKETEFAQQGLKGASEEQLIQAMVDTPKLMERPIVSNGSTAIIGRPPENVLSFFAANQ